ncbi:MAG TPA: GNAT family N-acetyltransferase [Pyrinomonadaceae bacterium]|nr:GNAT family N-acetyltransferase [Pyrinomonadaceae bacterium]
MLLPIIQTERLLLRMYKTGELESVYQLITDKDVTKFFPDYYSVKKEDVLASLPRRIERWRKYGFGQLGVFDKSGGSLIGYCGLQPLDDTDEIEIYYGFNKNYWGKGIATEAAKAVLRFGFEEVKLERIVAVTHLENFASQKVLLGLGLKQGKNTRFYKTEAAYFALPRKDYNTDEAAFYKLDYEEIN